MVMEEDLLAELGGEGGGVGFEENLDIKQRAADGGSSSEEDLSDDEGDKVGSRGEKSRDDSGSSEDASEDEGDGEGEDEDEGESEGENEDSYDREKMMAAGEIRCGIRLQQFRILQCLPFHRCSSCVKITTLCDSHNML